MSQAHKEVLYDVIYDVVTQAMDDAARSDRRGKFMEHGPGYYVQRIMDAVDSVFAEERAKRKAFKDALHEIADYPVHDGEDAAIGMRATARRTLANLEERKDGPQ